MGNFTQDSKLPGQENKSYYSGTDVKNSLLKGRRFLRGRKEISQGKEIPRNPWEEVDLK